MNILIINDQKPISGGLDFSFIKALQKNGHKTDIIFPSDKLIFKKYNSLRRISEKIINISKIRQLDISLKVKNTNLRPYDFIFVFKGYYVTSNLLRYIKGQKKFIACYNPDDPYNDAASNVNIQQSVSLYNLYFIWSRSLAEKIKNKEHVETIYLPLAADLNSHNNEKYGQNYSKEKIYGVTFIGNWDEEREKWLMNIDLKSELSIFGFNWNELKNKILLKAYQGKGVIKEEFLNIVQKSIINLNILRLQNKNSQNMRTFEIPASGGFLLHEYSEEVAEIFTEGKEIEFYRDKNELNDKIRYYLNNVHLSEKIALNAYKKIIGNNMTYDKRVEEIIENIKRFI